MGQLTDQVINQWSQRPAPQTPSPPSPLSLFEPDIKTSWGKSAIKSEILTPSHAVSIAPWSFKVEVDPLAYFEGDNAFSALVQRWSTMGFFQSVDIKATGKLAFKGDKEVAFKSESSVVYSAGDEKGPQQQKLVLSKGLVRVVVISSIVVAIAGEVFASQKLKTVHKILWFSHAGLSRILSWLFSAIQREYIKIELAETVRDAKVRADADAKLRADTERDNAIDVALNSVRDALNLNAAVAAAQADAAAAAAAGAQARADQNYDVLTRTIARLRQDVDFNDRITSLRLRHNSMFAQDLQDMVEKHQEQINELRQNGTGAAAAS